MIKKCKNLQNLTQKYKSYQNITINYQNLTINYKKGTKFDKKGQKFTNFDKISEKITKS